MTELSKLLDQARKRFAEAEEKAKLDLEYFESYDYADAKLYKAIYEECAKLLMYCDGLLVKVEVMNYYFQFMRVQGEYWLLTTNFE